MKKNLITALIIASSFFTGKSQAQDFLARATSGGKLKPLQAIMDIRHYTVALDVDIERKAIKGYAEIELNLSAPTDTLLFDFNQSYKIIKIVVDKKEQSFTVKEDQIFIINKSGYMASKHTARIYYEGNPPVPIKPPWDSGFTWAKDKSGNPLVNITCQFAGAKIYFPCKDHPSDEANEGADLFITIPNGLSVAGPGLLQSVKAAKDKKATWHWKTNYTISNYCIVFNIGKYKVYNRNYTTCEGNIVPIQLYILEQDTARAKYLLDIKERDAHILEKYFGEYPWVKEKIGIAEIPNSGMEHQTMITFDLNEKFISIPGNLDYGSVYFHEFAHEWWANKITNKDWAHMWIQEGITTYAEALAMRELGGEAAYDLNILNNRYKSSTRGNKQPIVPGEGLKVRDVYGGGDIYNKGAMLLNTLRYVVGDSLFFPTLKKFITNVKYPYNQFFTSDDVEQFFIKETGKDLKPIFDFYLRTTKKIEINVYQQNSDTYYLAVENAPMDSLPLDISTDTGIIHTTMNATMEKKFQIKSRTLPIIDPRGWYLRKVIYH
ncbi:MAG: M1 family metallopeptidase [Ferruginibacter sp.]